MRERLVSLSHTMDFFTLLYSATTAFSGLQQLIRQADRIATNRVVAGVHFPVDSAAGCVLGIGLCNYLVSRCTTHAAEGWVCDGAKYVGESDFDFRAILAGRGTSGAVRGYAAPISGNGVVGDDGASHPALAWLWKQASAEWREASQ